MKNLYLIIILTITTFTLTAQPSDSIDWQAVINDYYTKYQPQKSPAWLFPIIFEEGTGQRDTIYLGFDTRASFLTSVDTLFKEGFFDTIDVNSFFACWNSPFDSIIEKVNIGSIGVDFLGGFFELHNSQYPITMWWSRDLLYSDSLTLFPNINPAPRTEGLFYFDYGEIDFPCSWQYPILMTDTLNYSAVPSNTCYRSDSIRLEPDPWHPNISGFSGGLYFQAWTGNVTNTKDIKDDKMQILVYPNPADDEIFIDLKSSNTFNYKIINTIGQTVLNNEINQESFIQISTNELSNGLYYLILNIDNQLVRRPILVQH
jgi:hypothetical protein